MQAFKIVQLTKSKSANQNCARSAPEMLITLTQKQNINAPLAWAAQQKHAVAVMSTFLF